MTKTTQTPAEPKAKGKGLTRRRFLQVLGGGSPRRTDARA